MILPFKHETDHSGKKIRFPFRIGYSIFNSKKFMEETRYVKADNSMGSHQECRL